MHAWLGNLVTDRESAIECWNERIIHYFLLVVPHDPFSERSYVTLFLLCHRRHVALRSRGHRLQEDNNLCYLTDVTNTRNQIKVWNISQEPLSCYLSNFLPGTHLACSTHHSCSNGILVAFSALFSIQSLTTTNNSIV
jgi:hypothetical protein